MINNYEISTNILKKIKKNTPLNQQIATQIQFIISLLNFHLRIALKICRYQTGTQFHLPLSKPRKFFKDYYYYYVYVNIG